MKILMVCLGNICRSPLAAGILRKKIKAKGLNTVIDSAGTSDYHVGEPADPRTVETAKKYGVDLNGHRARQFVAADFDKYDKIYAMDRSNFNRILDLASENHDTMKVEMIMNVVEPGSNRDVPDPYFGLRDGFENVFRMLDEACEIIAEEIANNKES